MTRPLAYLSDASLDVLLSRGLAVARRSMAPAAMWPRGVRVIFELISEYIERHRTDRNGQR